MQKLLVAALLVTPLLVACPGPGGGEPDAGTDSGTEGPRIIGISPTEGPLAGGTTVLITGDYFQEGSKVFFGPVEATEVVYATAKRLSAKTPPAGGEGSVDVRVTNPDGQLATLSGAFSYVSEATPVIAQAKLFGPATVTDETGSDPVVVTIRADVEVANVTAGAGQGQGVRAQVGFMLASGTSLSELTWTDAAYDSDVDASDRYQGQVSVPGATGSEVKAYVVAARFSTNDGATWTIADLDGSSNGSTLDQLQRLEVAKNLVDWCKLGGQTVEAAPVVALKLGQAGPMIYAQVYEGGVTNAAGQGANVAMELGYGPSGSHPSAGGWTWTAATYNVDTGSGANDEYQAELPNPGEGSYAFAFRAQISGGGWRYCDADGTGVDEPYETEQAGTLVVTSAQIDKCTLQFPSTMQTVEGAPSPQVYGWVWSAGITNGAGKGAGIVAEVGYGPTGSDPATSAWTWSAAAYNAADGDKDNGAADEYEGSFIGPSPGTYDYALRFSVGATGTRVYCDRDGSDVNGYTSAQAGVLTANAASPVCRLISVTAPGQTTSVSTTESGITLEANGAVLIPGVTQLPGAAPNVIAQVGVGTAGNDASTDPAWGWQDAAFKADSSGTGEDFWTASFNAAYTGNRAVSFRFSTDNRATWTYCDLDTSANGYSAAQQAPLTVNLPSPATANTIDYCNLQFTDGTTAYGQLYEAGITDQATLDVAAFVVEFGFGKKVEDPGLAWTWGSTPTFNNKQNNNYEWQVTVPPTWPAGTYYTFRYRLASSSTAPWCYGDLDGNGANSGLNGFNGEKADQSANLGVVGP